jgi:peptidoglycan hydrolase-like protein with peptidoglycan-binding domain
MNRATRDALRDFQKREGLPIDVIAGPETEKPLIDTKGRQFGHGVNVSQSTELEDFQYLHSGDVKQNSG